MLLGAMINILLCFANLVTALAALHQPFEGQPDLLLLYATQCHVGLIRTTHCEATASCCWKNKAGHNCTPPGDAMSLVMEWGPDERVMLCEVCDMTCCTQEGLRESQLVSTSMTARFAAGQPVPCFVQMLQHCAACAVAKMHFGLSSILCPTVPSEYMGLHAAIGFADCIAAD